MKEGTGQQMQFPCDVGNQATRGTDEQVEHVRRLTGEAGTSAETKESLFSLRCRSWEREQMICVGAASCVGRVLPVARTEIKDEGAHSPG